MINIYKYTDYRKFLKDDYLERKSQNKRFNYKYIAQHVGFKSIGFFTQILQGKCNLSNKMIPKIADAFELKKREKKYFELLVRYNQSNTHEEKKALFEKMLSFGESPVAKIDSQHYEIFDKWYYTAIRAVLAILNFEDDYNELAKTLIPSITPNEAKKAIRVLESKNLIKKDDDNIYKIVNRHLTTGETSDSVVINNYVLNTLEIAKDALYRFKRTERSFSAISGAISEQGYNQILELADSFRKQVVEIIRNDKKVDRAYQVNLQIFPLTKLPSKTKEDNDDE